MYRYIIPAGLKFVFQDQEGNIIARIGKDGRVEDLGQSSKSAPIVIEDERGRELYRSKNLRGPSPTPRELRQGHFRTHVRSVYEEHNMDFGGDEVIATLDAGGYRLQVSRPSQRRRS
ncbi:hypothetical protein BDN70DRAFT_875036 [Pholiota conissans]|uniref:Uncharacterized protein n=1 Tax=Pholiota conissans TaxID=109636 RepID=A0A9P5Z6S5_9AGAR|nr:hypothetical protein BDN70DRAFT_875036 [Pholiota conissans]